MHNLNYLVYAFCIFIIATLGFSSVNSIKGSLEERTNRIDSVLSSYSVYLQNN